MHRKKFLILWFGVVGGADFNLAGANNPARRGWRLFNLSESAQNQSSSFPTPNLKHLDPALTTC